MRRKPLITVCFTLFALSALLYGSLASAKYTKNLQIGVDENGQTVKESVTVYKEPQKETEQTQSTNSDYIYINPYYNGSYPNYYYPTYYPNYYNGYGGYSYYGTAPMVYTYSLTGIKYGPDGRVYNPRRNYNPPPPPPRPIPHRPPHNKPPQGGLGHHYGGAHPNRH